MSKLLVFVAFALIANYVAVASLINIPAEANYNFTEYAASLNYPYEEHVVETTDGYLLTYFRIQAKNTQIQSGLPVVFAHHGLLDSADSWIINDEDQAPALILANQGYDVWFGNNRGNKYGLGHIDEENFNSSIANSAFWDFSWQEFSQYDLPAGFEYISEATGSDTIDYVGHSEGCTIMVAALARRDPIVLRRLNKFIALAPAVFLEHSASPIVKIGAMLKLGYILRDYDDLVHDKKFGFMGAEVRKLWESICVVALPVCIERIKLLTDADPDVDNTKRLTVTSGHFPAGTSVNNMMYWQQMYGKAALNMYDYGTAENLQTYGTATPPAYDLSLIEEPVYMFVGQYDELASPEDTATLRDSLTGSANVEYRTYPLGHSSFMWGLAVNEYMQDVLATLQA